MPVPAAVCMLPVLVRRGRLRPRGVRSVAVGCRAVPTPAAVCMLPVLVRRGRLMPRGVRSVAVGWHACRRASSRPAGGEGGELGWRGSWDEV